MTATSGTPTSIFTVTLATGTVMGAGIKWAVSAVHTNGTDLAVTAGLSGMTALNATGTAQANTHDLAFTSTEVSNGGSLTIASSVTVASNVITFRLTPTFSSFTPASAFVVIEMSNLGEQTISIL
jgi:hypothetical protein